jgi:hypothetical protein
VLNWIPAARERTAWSHEAEMTQAGRRSDGEVRAEAEQAPGRSVPAQYGECWLKMTARLMILPSRMPK